jgi:hypothetical protein
VADNVTTASYSKIAYGNLSGDYDYTDDFKEFLEYGFDSTLYFFAVSDAYFKSFAEGLSLNPNEYFNSGNPKALMYSQMSYAYQSRYKDYKIFKALPEKLNLTLSKIGNDATEEKALSLNYTPIDEGASRCGHMQGLRRYCDCT